MIKIRKTWQMSPVQKVHSSKKGKKGYKRNKSKEISHDTCCRDRGVEERWIYGGDE